MPRRSVKACALTVACFILWVVYGWMTRAWPIVVSNSLALVMASFTLVMKWRFREGHPTG